MADKKNTSAQSERLTFDRPRILRQFGDDSVRLLIERMQDVLQFTVLLQNDETAGISLRAFQLVQVIEACAWELFGDDLVRAEQIIAAVRAERTRAEEAWNKDRKDWQKNGWK